MGYNVLPEVGSRVTLEYREDMEQDLSSYNLSHLI